MPRVLLINAAEPEETRAALVEEGRLVEYRRERAAAAKLVGNIYLGRVVNIERGIGAAFVDCGMGRNAFLHVSDCLPAAPGLPERIEERFPVGERVLVQVTREPLGDKGPVLTAHVSLPGRFLVLLPFAEAGGVSRRMEGEGKEDLRALARELERREQAGLIVRTAAATATKRELVRDLRLLRKLWAAIEARSRTAQPPALLHSEGDLVGRALRDLADRDVDEIHADTPEALAHARETLLAMEPTLASRLRLHAGPQPLFHAFGIEEECDLVHARRVPLPGGGSLVFDRTEAMVTVDVNSGRTRHEEGLEETAFQTDLEAAAEVARQIRLRNLGGVIAIDFIDLRERSRVREVERTLHDHLRRDRSRVRTGRMGPFGVYVLTRRRAGDGSEGGLGGCPHCGGPGPVPEPLDTALRVYRELSSRPRHASLLARLDPAAARLLLASREAALRGQEGGGRRRLRVVADPALPPGVWEVEPLRAP